MLANDHTMLTVQCRFECEWNILDLFSMNAAHDRADKTAIEKENRCAVRTFFLFASFSFLWQIDQFIYSLFIRIFFSSLLRTQHVHTLTWWKWSNRNVIFYVWVFLCQYYVAYYGMSYLYILCHLLIGKFHHCFCIKYPITVSECVRVCVPIGQNWA